MVDFKKELEAILADDPLGLLDVKPKASSVISADERLVASFEEINVFFQEHGRKPAASRDIRERQLYSRLKGLQENPEKGAALAELDTFDLLGTMTVEEPKDIYSIDDVLRDDSLGLLGDESAAEEDGDDIFTLKHVARSIDMPDLIAKRKPCKEFNQFEPLFKSVHAELVLKKKVTRPFTSERHIIPGAFFLLQGMIVYVANKGKWVKKKHGNINARLYCVFENGTESNMLLRSLAAALWKDENSRHIVDADQLELFDSGDKLGSEDEATGFIYVLRSLSEDLRIAEIDDLYKIGFSSVPVRQRIQNAAEEPTYLMAAVKLVTVFETYNLNPQKLELLLHTFFAKSCLNLDVFDGQGKRHTPREWFIVPLHVIETAVQLLINGEIVHYRYDHHTQEIVER